jgi:hypothetical protein
VPHTNGSAYYDKKDLYNWPEDRVIDLHLLVVMPSVAFDIKSFNNVIYTIL